MSKSEHNELDKVIYERGVDVGAAVFVESADNHILLIRRAKHLRTFPNIWVPAGGHVEQGETVGLPFFVYKFYFDCTGCCFIR